MTKQPKKPDPSKPRENRKCRWQISFTDRGDVTVDTDFIIWTDIVSYAVHCRLISRSDIPAITGIECLHKPYERDDISSTLWPPRGGQTRFRVDVDVNFTRRVVYEVDAKTMEEAVQLVEDGDTKAKQVEIDQDEEFVDQDVRFAFNPATGEEADY